MLHFPQLASTGISQDVVGQVDGRVGSAGLEDLYGHDVAALRAAVDRSLDVALEPDAGAVADGRDADIVLAGSLGISLRLEEGGVLEAAGGGGLCHLLAPSEPPCCSFRN